MSREIARRGGPIRSVIVCDPPAPEQSCLGSNDAGHIFGSRNRDEPLGRYDRTFYSCNFELPQHLTSFWELYTFGELLIQDTQTRVIFVMTH